MEREVCRALNEEGVDDEVIDFLIKLSLDYRTPISRILFRQNQGRDWWSNISNEIIIKGDQILVKYNITLDLDREVTITTNFSSSILLGSNFIGGAASAINRFEDVNKNELTGSEIRELALAYEYLFDSLGYDVSLEEDLIAEGVLDPREEE
jgi:hypothetical protein